MTFDVCHDYERGREWREFSLIELRCEVSHFCGLAEIHAAVLGVHLRVSWVTSQDRHDAFVREMNTRKEFIVPRGGWYD